MEITWCQKEEEPRTLTGEGSRHKENRAESKQNEVTAGAMTRTCNQQPRTEKDREPDNE